MGDDRFSYLHLPSSHILQLLDDDDERLGWDLPDDDIQVPYHLLPPYQDEQDESALPSQTHPSYPYGNPYKPSLLPSPSRRAGGGIDPARPPFSAPSTHAASLATTLPALELRELFQRTTLGEAPDRHWPELHLPGLLGRRTRAEREEEEEEEHAAAGDAQGDAGPPAGQNAADAPDDEGSDPDGADLDDEGSHDGVIVQ